MSEDLNNHHRDTLRKIFSHPASGNLEWRQVLSLLEAIGTVSEDHNGKITIDSALGIGTIVNIVLPAIQGVRA